MAYWLVKSEPATWSWDQHAAAGADAWTGVRNHQAKLHLANMKPGDGVLFYHSGDAREIVGVSRVARASYADPTDPGGKFLSVDLEAKAPLARPLALAQIKSDPALADMVLVKNSRLSVQPVTSAEWRHILALTGAAD